MVIDKLCNQLNTKFVVPNRRMGNFGIAVFGNEIEIVAHDVVLAGGPDFSRVMFPPALYGAMVLNSIHAGGKADLLEMMKILRSGRFSRKNALRLYEAINRFAQRPIEMQNDWILNRDRAAL